jgi:hypothetical protein
VIALNGRNAAMAVLRDAGLPGPSDEGAFSSIAPR